MRLTSSPLLLGDVPLAAIQPSGEDPDWKPKLRGVDGPERTLGPAVGLAQLSEYVRRNIHFEVG